MNTAAWLLDPKVAQAVHDDLATREFVDALHDCMSSGHITAEDIARHLGSPVADIRATLSDPLAVPGRDLSRVLGALGLTLGPATRRADD